MQHNDLQKIRFGLTTMHWNLKLSILTQ